MLCPSCGEANAVGAKFCARCGSPLPAEAQPSGGTPPAQPAAPSGSVLGIGTPRAPQSFAPAPQAPPAQSSGKAIASLICGLFAWIFPAAVAAIILGHVSLSEIGRSAGRLKGRGVAITGLVLGYAGIVFIPFILIIAAIAIPNLLRARQAANEAAAVGTLRTINVAAITYSTQYENGFPPSLAAMDGEETGGPGCDHAQLIDSRLALGEKNGYVFAYIATGAQTSSEDAKARGCTVPGSSSFEVHADPITRGTTGQRSFYTDQTGVIRFEASAPAGADSAPLE
jgi:type IV pilus assembly protein PilA